MLLTGPEDLGRIELRKRDALVRLDSNPELLDDLVGIISAAALVTQSTPLRGGVRAANLIRRVEWRRRTLPFARRIP